MIRMVQSTASAHARKYFSEALSKADYYIGDQELAGVWEGLLAARLGLSGNASKEAFFALCENRDPATGAPLTPRTGDQRRVGYDINFHAPKSVSLLHVLSQDDHILKAFQQSVRDTMREIEADSKTRVRQGKVYDDRATGELAWAHFLHQTARPVEGFTPDPHLHAHCFVFNATWDETEQRIKAGQFGDIKRDMPFYQALFHHKLAENLMVAGYTVRRTAKSFEIDGVPQRVIDLFSKRTDEIGRVAREKGITDAKELSELGARTRAKKQKGATMRELQKDWRQQIAALGSDHGGEGSRIVRFQPVKAAPAAQAAQACVDYALQHCFERASVMDGRRLLATAFRQGLGKPGVSVGGIEQAFAQDRRIINVQEKGRRLCTTKEVLAEEKRMVDLARQGQGKMKPLYRQAPAMTLDGQQAAAVAHVLTTSHRVSIIRGAAGSGKTTLMREAVRLIEEAGKKVIPLAPSASASRGVLREEGFSGAETVAKFLADKDMQQQVKGQVLWVDEAGLLGTKDAKSLLEIATAQNARVIFGGDTRQHASVVRGDALRILNTVAGIDVAEVNRIYRQKGAAYRAAVEDLAKGDIDSGFRKLDGMGAIRETDGQKPDAGMIGDYVDALKSGKTALMVSPTHAQGDAATEEIRSALRKEGMIGKKEIGVRALRDRKLTQAEKSDPQNYAAGQVVQFTQNAKGFQRGSRWTVKEADREGVRVEGPAGETKTLPLDKSDRFNLYAPQSLPLSKGDKVRITQNGFDADGRRLNNGDMLDVAKVTKNGPVVLQNPVSGNTYKLPQDYGHLTHGHCVTSHAAQGRTVDKAFIFQPAASFAATDAKQFYVSLSRARESAQVYTDDKAELLRHAKELGQRQSAVELTQGKDRHTEAVMQQERRQKAQEQEKQKTIIRTRDDEFDRDI